MDLRDLESCITKIIHNPGDNGRRINGQLETLHMRPLKSPVSKIIQTEGDQIHNQWGMNVTGSASDLIQIKLFQSSIQEKNVIFAVTQIPGSLRIQQSHQRKENKQGLDVAHVQITPPLWIIDIMSLVHNLLASVHVPNN